MVSVNTECLNPLGTASAFFGTNCLDLCGIVFAVVLRLTLEILYVPPSSNYQSCRLAEKKLVSERELANVFRASQVRGHDKG